MLILCTLINDIYCIKSDPPSTVTMNENQSTNQSQSKGWTSLDHISRKAVTWHHIPMWSRGKNHQQQTHSTYAVTRIRSVQQLGFFKPFLTTLVTHQYYSCWLFTIRYTIFLFVSYDTIPHCFPFTTTPCLSVFQLSNQRLRRTSRQRAWKVGLHYVTSPDFCYTVF